MNLPIRRGVEIVREEGVKPLVAKGMLNAVRPIVNTSTSRFPTGTNIFDREWDVLVILDACRSDVFHEVSQTTPWLDDVGEIKSVGSMSPEWILKTFTPEYRDEISDTALLSGNVWTDRIFEDRLHEQTDHGYPTLNQGAPKWEVATADDFAYYERVLPIANQDIRLLPESTHLPHVMTDRAIALSRENDFDRLIVWYEIPHLKLIADALDWKSGELSVSELMSGPEQTRDLRATEKSFDPARRGEVSIREMHELYERNVQFVLDYVKILAENVEAERLAISADHGETLGEFGVWGHPFGSPLSAVRSVPWATVTATDERTYEPKFDALEREPAEEEVEEILADMGYI
ncbi:hypothetical protein [Halosimplex sp. J119]